MLAALLSINSVLLLWQWRRRNSTTLMGHWQQEWTGLVERLLLVGMWLSVGAVLFVGMWFLFIGYLLQQWLID
jgi:hypothetical protein